MSRLLADRYELREVVGAGGVARVHRAVDHHLQRDVAVKVLDDDQARSADPSGRDRFLREARSAARLHHPHLVTIYDAGEDAGELFLVMELVDGQSLAALIAQRAPLPVDEAVSIAVQILEGLGAVHADGVIHRDIKPANVLVDSGGRVRLTDFGIAKRLDEIEENLTSSGMVVGTPTYLAPEQAVGGRLSVATDIYLVGLVLYEMLTGTRPAGTALDPGRVRGDVPPAVAAAVVRATDADPQHRFASAQEMIDALRAAPPRVATMAFPVSAVPVAAVPVAAIPVAAAGGRVAATTAMPTARKAGAGAGATTAMPAARKAGAGAAATEIAPVQIDPVTPARRISGWWLLAAVATVLAVIVGLLMIADASPSQPAQPALSTTVGSTAPVAPVASAPVTVAVAVAPPAPANDQGGGHGHGKKKKGHEDG